MQMVESDEYAIHPYISLNMATASLITLNSGIANGSQGNLNVFNTQFIVYV